MTAMVTVRTVPTLMRIHAALREVARTGDTTLLASADSVLSALVVVLKREEARIPAAMRPHIERLPKA